MNLWTKEISTSLNFLFFSEAQRKYEDNCDSLHEESVSETAENSGEEAGEVALEVEAGEMTDGGEDDYDEEGSHHLVRRLTGPSRRGRKVLWEILRRPSLCCLKDNFPELFMAADLTDRGFTWVNESAWAAETMGEKPTHTNLQALIKAVGLRHIRE